MNDGKIKKKWLLFAWYWLPLAVYAGTIFFFSSLSHPPLPTVDIPHFDKVLHCIEYFGFGMFLCRGLTMGSEGFTPRSAFFWTIALGAVYGASDEFHQYFVPHRTADVFDFFADLTGAFLGGWIYKAFATRYFSRRIVSETE